MPPCVRSVISVDAVHPQSGAWHQRWCTHTCAKVWKLADSAYVLMSVKKMEICTQTMPSQKTESEQKNPAPGSTNPSQPINKKLANPAEF